MSSQQITPPTTEPLTIAAAKAIIRTDNDSAEHDAWLASLITTARQQVEHDTGRRLMTQTWRHQQHYWPREPYILLPTTPVQRIAAIEFNLEHTPDPLDAEATPEDPAETGYIPLTGADAGWLLSEDTATYQTLALLPSAAWPTEPLRPPGLVITYICGYATPPAPLVEAMAALLTYWYDNPEAAIASTAYKAEVGIMPFRYQTLIQPYIMWRR